MNKKTIVLADPDVEYLAPLQSKLFSEAGNSINVEVITSEEYFQEYFAAPRRVDLLLTDEKLYTEELLKQDIGAILVLSETERDSEDFRDTRVRYLYKYTSTKKIFDEIIYWGKNELKEIKKSKETQVVLIYSPSGGCGKTTIALGLSQFLQEKYKKVLYVDAESIQSFQVYLNIDDTLSAREVQMLRQENIDNYKAISACICEKGFSYLPPLMGVMTSWEIGYPAYIRFIENAKKSGDYDYIIVDTDSCFSESKAEMVRMADKAILIVNNTLIDSFKMEMFLKSVSAKNNDKFIFICNKYQESDDSRKYLEQYLISGYVKQFAADCEQLPDDLSGCDDIRNLTYLFE